MFFLLYVIKCVKRDPGIMSLEIACNRAKEGRSQFFLKEKNRVER